MRAKDFFLKVDEAMLAIDRWKAHLIRSWNQEQARSSIVQHLSDGDAIITCDWAMKFLPRKYREGIDSYLNLQLKMLNITN